jgi:hypothetical protein
VVLIVSVAVLAPYTLPGAGTAACKALNMC